MVHELGYTLYMIAFIITQTTQQKDYTDDKPNANLLFGQLKFHIYDVAT